MLIGVGVPCRISYSIVCYLYVSFNGLITSVREERANFSGSVYLRNRSALAVNCYVIIHCLEVSCKEDQITSTQRE